MPHALKSLTALAAAVVTAAALGSFALAQSADTCPTPTGGSTTTTPYPTGGSPYDPGADTGDDAGSRKGGNKKEKRDRDPPIDVDCPTSPGAGGGTTTGQPGVGGGVVSTNTGGPTSSPTPSGKVKVEGKGVVNLPGATNR